MTIVGNSVYTSITEAQTQAPDTTAPVALTLSLLTDSGSSGTDKITNVATLSAAGLEGGTTKAEYQLGAAGPWVTDLASVTAGLNSGTYTVNAKQTDLAGNVSTTSAFTFTLDKGIPLAPTLTLANDTGTPGDKVTSVATLTVGPLEGGTTKAEYQLGPNGAWVTDLASVTAGLNSGTYTVNAKQTDLAGNVSTTSAFTFTLDKGIPLAPTLTLANDTGTPGDKVTSVATLAVGPLEGGQTTAEYQLGAAGAWVTDLASVTAGLNSGTYTVNAKQTDLAGNVSTPSAFTFTLDKDVPLAPTLTLANDTGTPGDKVTSVATLAVGPLEGGTTKAEYQLGPNGAWVTDLASVTAGLNSGTHTVNAKQTDLAGNVSAPSAFTFTFDKDIPVAPTLSLQADNGINGDKITNVAALNATGLEGGTTKAEYQLGGAGPWVTDLASVTAGLNSSTYTVNAKQTDLAGNVSTPSAFTFTLDKDVPLAPTLTLANDTGTPGDKVTSDATLAVGPLEGGTTKAEYQLGSNGAWVTDLASVTAGLNSGTYTVNAKQTDLAGNVSTTGEFTFTLDKDVPVAPTLSLQTDSGSDGADKITNVAALSAAGLEGGQTKAEYQLGPNGAWVTDLASITVGLGSGDYTVNAKQTDLAGNVSTPSEFTFTLDQTAPSPTVVFGHNNLLFGETTSVDITFAETVVQFGLEDLTATGGVLNNFQKINDSTFKATFNATTGFVGVGSVNIAATYFDIAGNTGSAQKAGELIIDATAPVIPTPNGPTPNPTDVNSYDGQIAALIVADFVNGGTPATAAKLADLSAFAKMQYGAYVNQGVANPGLGPYEALGRGFAETAIFQTKYGALSESIFIQSTYKAVFGKDASAAQQQHFQDQIDYFEGIYEKANLLAPQAESLAKGAVLGQMLGVATLEGPSSEPFLAEATAFLVDAADGKVDFGLPLSHWDVA